MRKVAIFKISKSKIIVYNEIEFRDASVNQPTEWLWDFGDESTSSEQNPKHTYMQPGTYTPSLIVKNKFGQDRYSKPHAVVVEAIPSPGFCISNRIAQVGEEMNYKDTSNFNGVEWIWDFGDGVQSNDKSPNHAYSATGVYSVKLTIKHEYGEIVNQKKDYVRVYEEVVKDIDNINYGIVKIGNQKWMAQNFKTIRLNNGKEISFAKNMDAWKDSVTPLYSWFNYDKNFADSLEYGAHYNYYTVQTAKICPIGWHVPNKVDWETLTTYLSSQGYYKEEGLALKAKFGWKKKGMVTIFMVLWHYLLVKWIHGQIGVGLNLVNRLNGGVPVSISILICIHIT